MDAIRLEYLFDRYVSQKCSLEEEKELMSLLGQPENEAFVQTLIDRVIKNTGSEMQMPKQVAASILENILQKDEALVVPINKGKSVLPWMKVAVAAAVILFVAGAIYWILSSGDEKNAGSNKMALSQKTSPITPGGNHAILTMADGSTIVLDSIQNGKIQQGGAKISKQNGLLIFNGTSSNSVATVSFNTLRTPRGGQYKVVLADGSEVWLNASSSLRFPTAFTGNQREVELTGEAYFEVAKNKEKPFRVKVGDMQVNVLGTHFNINAYSDESAVRTSLLEGSVKIIKGKTSGLLKPGEQGTLKWNDDKLEIKEANMNEVMAWKNGLFQFEGADITTIMKQISRWYDVEIVYSGKVPVRRFEGKISRDAQLSDVLKILELSDVKFTVEGKKIIVQ
jgi:ferric-dicitrate binding protein FerR (iron transport regulator)